MAQDLASPLEVPPGLAPSAGAAERVARLLFDADYYVSRSGAAVPADVDPYQHFLQVGWRQGFSPSPLFDTTYYLQTNPDIAAGGINPFLHFVENGGREGRRPHPLFDSAWYLKANPDIAASDENPLHHYVAHGAAEGRKPHPLFDSAWYLRSYPHVARAGLNPLAHYVDAGVAEGRNPNPLFDTLWYLETNPDIAQAGVNPLAHYAEAGFREERQPHPLFAIAWYLRKYKDIAQAGLEPLAHFLEHGAQEGRNPNPLFDVAWFLKTHPDAAASDTDPIVYFLERATRERLTTHPLFAPGWYLDKHTDAALSGVDALTHYLSNASRSRDAHPLFDDAWYLNTYPDVARAGLNPLLHYLEHGAKEARNPNPLFDTAWYLKTYPDVAATGVNPLAHYAEHGAREGRKPNPLFDTAFYLTLNPDIASAGLNPLAHYIHHGYAEGRKPHPFFDPAYYLARYPDIAEHSIEPLGHFLAHGYKECRQPHPLFDCRWYLEAYPDAADAGVNPLLDFIERSGVERRNPNPLFDTEFYINTYPDVPKDSASAFAHYLQHGVAQKCKPNALFHTEWYLEAYPEVLASGTDPLVHYLDHGVSERLKPHPLFDGRFYLSRNPDIAAGGINPLVHYLHHGHKEHRQPHALFDIAWYLRKYPELASVRQNLLVHFIDTAAREGRNPNAHFDTSWYLKTYPDIAAARENPLVHYLRRGVQEGRNPNASFDTAWYLAAYPGVAAAGFNPLEHYLLFGRALGWRTHGPKLPPLAPFFDRTAGATPTQLVDLIRAAARAPSDAPLVTVIVPVYQQLEYTLRCILRLYQSSDRTPFEILVVDDRSPDGSGEFLAEHLGNLPALRVTRNRFNMGFLRSCNAAASLLKTKYLFFLNNDTAVLDGWLDELVSTFRDCPEAGLVGSKLVYPDGRLQEAGGIIWRDAGGANFGRLDDPRKPEYNYLRDVDYVSGAAILVDRALWRDLGGFTDEFAPAYYEDTDFAMKVRAAGRRVLYQPLSVVVHYEGVSSGTDITKGVKRHQAINKEKFLAKWRTTLDRHGAPADFSAPVVDRTPKARVLIFDADTPTPDRDSGSITAYYYMRLLAQLGYRVTFVPENLLWRGRYSLDLQRHGVEVIFAPYETNARDFVLRNGERFDLFFLSRVTHGGHLVEPLKREFPGKPIVFDTVDLHHLRVARQYEIEHRQDLLDEAYKLKALEFGAIRNADLTILVSDYEIDYLKAEIGPFPNLVIPLIYEDFVREAGFADRRDVAFVGGYRHQPNVDAVRYLAEKIWPLFRRYETGAKLHLIGSHMPPDFQDYACDDIVVTGFVEDLDTYMKDIRLTVAPLRYGAGVKGKVGNSLRMGVPVVGTPMALEGMGLRHGEHVLAARTPEEFARAMADVYNDADLWERLSRQGQTHVLRQFGLAAARARLDEMCTGLIGARRGA